MSPNRPSRTTGTDDSLTVRVSRELEYRGEDGRVKLCLHPCTAGEPPRGSLLDETVCEKLLQAVLDAFDVDSVPELRSLGTDRHERKLCLGTAVIAGDSVEFEPDDSLLVRVPAVAD